MKKLKACPSKDCSSGKKKYKESDSYCINCGRALVVVCKKCRSVLSVDNEDSLCPECAEKARVKNKKLVKAAGKALAMAGSVTLILLTAFPKLKEIEKISKKLKKKK